jgi:hypothetical protein
MNDATLRRRSRSRFARRLGGLVVISAAMAAIVPAVSSAAIIDTDKDGLGNLEERLQYKTDPWKADTDNDGLQDGEEVKTHKTDPNNRDTDGDGYTDGDEVHSLVLRSNPLDPNSVPVRLGTRPETRIDQATISAKTLRVFFSSPDRLATFQCRVGSPILGGLLFDDWTGWKACRSPETWDLGTLSRYSAGKQVRVDVRAVNAGGDTDLTPATQTLK